MDIGQSDDFLVENKQNENTFECVFIHSMHAWASFLRINKNYQSNTNLKCGIDEKPNHADFHLCPTLSNQTNDVFSIQGEKKCHLIKLDQDSEENNEI